MIVIPKRALILPVLSVALAVVTVAPPAQASAPASVRPSRSSVPLYFSAALSGANEMAVPGGPAVGDPDGSGKAEVSVSGSRVTFAVVWKGISAPTMGHLHTGAAGVNGEVKVPLFGTPMPAGSTGGAGVVMVHDAGLVAAIVAHPADFYLNLHTAQFPAGAVRGQLHPARRDRNPLDLLRGLPLQTLMNGSQEVPAGDPHGHGIGMIRASGHRLMYTFAWNGIAQPTMAHIHVGPPGTSGPIVAGLFDGTVPANIYGITGQVRIPNKRLVTAIRQHPTAFYVNLHTADHPTGALRGQLTHPHN
jgi:hypothetical protein